MKKFQKAVWDYYRREGRDLPWRPPSLKLRKDREALDPYRVLVSEMMLQQTQVSRVLPKYELFLKQFPDFKTLAEATPSQVLAAWQGLGYNRRALYLKRTSEIVLREHGGRLPDNAEALRALPGVGRGTAGALLAFAFNQPVAFMETNIRRTYIDWFFRNRGKVSDAAILARVEKTVDQKNSREWYYALMDYGAMLGRTAKENPNARSTSYRKQAPLRGSVREVRGQIIKLLVGKNSLSFKTLKNQFKDGRLEPALNALEKEGFIRRTKATVTIA